MPEAGLPWLRESSWTSVRGGNSDKLEMKLPIYLNVTGVPMSSRMFEFKEERMHRGRMIVVYKDRQQGYLDILFRTVRERGGAHVGVLGGQTEGRSCVAFPGDGRASRGLCQKDHATCASWAGAPLA